MAVALLAGSLPLATARRRTRALVRLRERAAEVGATAEPDLLPEVSSSQELALVTGTINDTIRRLQTALATQRRFVADAAHELRSPLATMIATLEIARTYPEEEAAEHTTARVLEQARRLQRLVEDLLLLAALDARAPARRDPVDLAGVVREVVEGARLRDGVRLRSDLPDDLEVIVPGDEDDLERVLINLLDNAIRHAERTVTVSCVAGAAARVEVTNDDLPIPPADAERIFDRFVRLDDARTRDAGGTGLGLAKARQLARRHGGDIAVVQAGPDRTTFRLTVPAR